MKFDGIKMIDIGDLRLSQIYLSQEKLDGVHAWFVPTLTNFQPIFVRDFLNNGNLHITDGHSRTFVAWQRGIEQVPCIYDEDEIVTSELGQAQYEKDIEWCERFHVHHISDLADRILTEHAYEALWRGRCWKMCNLEAALLERKICVEALNQKKAALAEKGLFVYGISEDLATLYFENDSGELFEIPYTA